MSKESYLKHEGIDKKRANDALYSFLFKEEEITDSHLDDYVERMKGVEVFDTPYRELFDFLEDEKKSVNMEKVAEYGEAVGRLEKMKTLRGMSFAEAVTALDMYANSREDFNLLVKKLDSFDASLREKKSTKQIVGDFEKKEYRKNLAEEFTSSLLSTVMAGSVEMKAVESASNRIKSRTRDEDESFSDIVLLNGPGSGVLSWHESNRYIDDCLGMYTVLINVSEAIKKQIKRSLGDGVSNYSDRDLDKKVTEIMAERIVDIYDNYTPVLGFSYGYEKDEEFFEIEDPVDAFAWAEMNSLAREKILALKKESLGEKMPIYNIGRFSGKCGKNKYELENQRISSELESLRSITDEIQKLKVLEKFNRSDMLKITNSLKGGLDSLGKKIEKRIENVGKLELPEEEKTLQRSAVFEWGEIRREELYFEFEGKKVYIKTRTISDLISDIEDKQRMIQSRYEKSKSIFDRAVDLKRHFDKPTVVFDEIYNRSTEEYESESSHSFSPFCGVIDWLNIAPVGTIKKAHKMIERGFDDDSVVLFSILDIIKKGKTEDQDSRKNKLNGLDNLKMSEELVLLNHFVSGVKNGNEDIKRKVKKLFDLSKFFSEEIESDISLSHLVDLSRSDNEFCYIEDAVYEFGIDIVLELVRKSAKLSTASMVKKLFTKLGYYDKLTIDQIALFSIESSDFREVDKALKNLSFSQVEFLWKNSIPYMKYDLAKRALRNHGKEDSFDFVVSICQSFASYDNNNIYFFDKALDLLPFDWIVEVINKGLNLGAIVSVAKEFKEKNINVPLDDLLNFSQKVFRYDLLWDFLSMFSLDEARLVICEKNLKLYSFLEKNKKLKKLENLGDYRLSKLGTKLSGKDRVNIVTLILLERLREEEYDDLFESLYVKGFSFNEVEEMPYLIFSTGL